MHPMSSTQEVEQLLTIIAREVPSRLPANLLGIYLRGSLAMGDFRPQSSDIDLLAVTHQRVNEAEFARLADLHSLIAQGDHPYAKRIEIAYIEREALRRYRPNQHFPTLGQGEALRWTEHSSNWILERWVVREHGIALFGPLPITLIEPITREEIAAAVRARLQDWAAWARNTDDPEWHLPASHKFYVVETMCRALHTLATGQIASKPQAADWARQTLPEPWRGLVERSQHWQMDSTVDDSLIEPVRDFVLWAAARGAD